MKGWKRKAATALVVVLVGMQVMPAAADETVKKDTWELTDGGWVYWNGSGDQIVGRKKTIHGKTYYFDEDGIMASEEFVEIGAETYYAYPEGELAHGEKGNGQWLYLTDDGILLSDNTSDEGAWYCFDNDGVMLRNERIKTDGSSSNYFGEDGKLATESWVWFGTNGNREVFGADIEPDFDKEGTWRYYGYDGYEASEEYDEPSGGDRGA